MIAAFQRTAQPTTISGADYFLAAPERICQIIPNAAAYSFAELVELLNLRLASMDHLAATQSWAYDFSRHAALRQARAACGLHGFAMGWARVRAENAALERACSRGARS